MLACPDIEASRPDALRLLTSELQPALGFESDEVFIRKVDLRRCDILFQMQNL